MLKRYIWLLVLTFAISAQTISDPGLPKDSIKCEDCEVVWKNYYVVNYSHKHKVAKWVMYRLTDRMTHGTNVRMSYFKKDAMLYGEPASYDDYVGSGYDRGHLVPADDMVFNTQAIEETYYMSNVAPQTPNLNRGLWKKIENYIRHRIIADHSYYIIAGPLLNDQLPKIPNTDISVPFYYYKIVLDIEFPEFKAIAFLVPNRKVSGALHQFVVSIDYLERMTGMDFFPLIESCLQEKLESEINLEQWELK